MTQIFLYTNVSSFPDPGNWNPSENLVECLSHGGNGAQRNFMGPETGTEAGGAGGGGGGYAVGRNLAPSFPVPIQISTVGSSNFTAFNNAAVFITAFVPNSVSVRGAFSASFGVSGTGGGSAALGATSVPWPEGFAGGTGGTSLQATSGYGGGGGGGAAGPLGPGSNGGAKPTGHNVFGAGGAANNGTVPGASASGQVGNEGREWDNIHGIGGGGAGSGVLNAPGGNAGYFGGGGGGAQGQGVNVVGQGRPGLIVITYSAPVPPRLATFMA